MLSLLPLAGTIAATFLWLSAPQATQKERTNTPINPANKIAAPAPTIVQKEKKPAPMPRQSAQQTLSKGHSKDKVKSLNILNIQGITAIDATADELIKLGISKSNDCGVTVVRNGSSATYYYLDKFAKTHIYDSIRKNQIHQSPLDSMMEARMQTRTNQDTNSMFTSVRRQSLNQRPPFQNDFPLLITSADGHILSDNLKERVGDESNSLARKDVEYLESHNPENKPTSMIWLEPKDSSMTEKDIQNLIGDTANTLVLVRRLTPADVALIAQEKEARVKKINEYLRMNNLIAVKVESACPNHSLLFWYEPNEEFINNLNERYRAGLYKEMLGKDYMSVTTDTLWLVTDTAQDKPQTGCEYSDICRATSGAVLESNVFPNPASEKISLTFRLNADRRCTFSLHDLNGIYIKDLGTDMQYLKGEQTFTAPLGDTGAGVYLLSMHTDKDERIVQRVIIKK